MFLFLQVLMQDVLRPYVPEYKGQVTSEDGERILYLIFIILYHVNT